MRFKGWKTRIGIISLVLVTVLAIVVISNGGRSNKTTSIQPDWDPPKVQLQSDNFTQQPTFTVTPSPSKSPTPIPSPTKSPTPKAQKKIAKTTQTIFKTTAAFSKYRPKYELAWVNPSNYGERFATDINGFPLQNQPIIVLHETAGSASSAVNTFQVDHADDENQQRSYHALIKLNGTVVYLVPPDKRAYGAGNSIFNGPNGEETVRTNAILPPSVNNFAYHVSLETPPEGINSDPEHIGYTQSQYYSLAWLVAQSQVPDNRITTHRAVDRSGQRIDPRSFDFNQFLNLLHSFRKLTVIRA
jgi:hypothetical protein